MRSRTQFRRQWEGMGLSCNTADGNRCQKILNETCTLHYLLVHSMDQKGCFPLQERRVRVSMWQQLQSRKVARKSGKWLFQVPYRASSLNADHPFLYSADCDFTPQNTLMWKHLPLLLAHKSQHLESPFFPATLPSMHALHKALSGW